VDRFRAIAAFAKVVESGSFARAAQRLDISVSAVSRQVAELEAHLDSRLLNRTTRRLSLTESGRVFYERCVQLLADLEEAEQSAHAGSVKPRGTLRITCGTTFGVLHLAPAIIKFVERFPEMRFDVELSDRTVDLVEEGFDVAVRIGNIGSQNLVGRKVGETRLLCCASPAYLARHGEPRQPEELVAHACLTYEHAPQKNLWSFRDQAGRERSVRVSGPLHTDSGGMLSALCVAGLGIIVEPDFQTGPEVRAGRLVRILKSFELAPISIYVAYPSRRHLSAKVRAFSDFLSGQFSRSEGTMALDAADRTRAKRPMTAPRRA